MLLINIFFLLLLSPVFADDVQPLGDNILFAFERCQTLSVDLKKGGLQVATVPGFDMHCMMSASNALEYKCDYIDLATNKKTQLEVVSGGKKSSNVSLMSKGGTTIRFIIGNQSAYYMTALSDNESIQGSKVCSGIFLLEKDALKKKK